MQNILITGANRGIGLELVRQYLQAGHSVIAACRTPGSADELNAMQQSRLQIVPMEVTEQASVDAASQQLAQKPVDVLINNAGIMGGAQSLDDIDYDQWLQTFAVNTLAPFRVTSAFLPQLQLASTPRAITISSMMGSLSRSSGVGAFAYRSSKAAVNKVMQGMAVELRELNIIVCPMHPGWVRTDMGGPTAEISVEESASGIIKRVDSLTMEESGRFWNWDGTEHPW